jgi:hypothetical protein
MPLGELRYHVSGIYHNSLSSVRVCLYVYPRTVPKRLLSTKRYGGNKHTHNDNRKVGGDVLYASRAVSKKVGD